MSRRDGPVPWMAMQGPCPACGGSGFVEVGLGGKGGAPFSIGDIFLWGIVSGIGWAIAGCVCALCVFQPVGSMVGAFAFGCAIIGACAGVFALFSFFGIYAVTRDLSTSYGVHLTLMSVLALAVGLVGALSVLPHMDLPVGVELRHATLRASVCSIAAIFAMVTSLRTIGKFGLRSVMDVIREEKRTQESVELLREARDLVDRMKRNETDRDQDV